LIFFAVGNAAAQVNLPPPYEIKGDIPAFALLPLSNWQVLEDKSGRLSIDQVTTPYFFTAFHPDSSEQKGVDYKVHTYWTRFRLANPAAMTIDICLVDASSGDYSDYYIFRGQNNPVHVATGFLCPSSRKGGLKEIDAIPVQLNPGEEITIYNRISNGYYFNKPSTLSVAIGSREKMVEQYYVAGASKTEMRIVLVSIFTGILVFSMLINLFFFFIVTERLFIYYVLFLCYFSFPQAHSPIGDLLAPDSPGVLMWAFEIVNALGIFLFVQFLRYFLKTFEKVPRWDRFLRMISLLSPLAFYGALFIEPHLSGRLNGMAYYISEFIFDAGLLMILITLILHRKDQNPLTNILITAAIPPSFFWAFGFTSRHLYYFLNDHYNVAFPAIIRWLNGHFNYINMACVTWFVAVFSWILILRFMRLRKDNIQQKLETERLAREKEVERRELIEQQKVELEKTVAERTAALKESLEDLKSTQAQLIQSEKMASLGELTAGIAHEIQNPLNFVNNFSELNQELIGEADTELAGGNTGEAMAILKDIRENEEKIVFHGRRAEVIVKGMLQHSRTSSTRKEPTDLNALCDEYFRLAYQGFRSKEKELNVEFHADFDPRVDLLNIVPQDIGRVLLNLYNNALYALNEKVKMAPGAFQPAIFLTTHKEDRQVTIVIRDNAGGIPGNIIGKIFQPFFTTKPTGTGTGLGLSMAYDIIKAHAGDIQVETKEHEGTSFIIRLPA